MIRHVARTKTRKLSRRENAAYLYQALLESAIQSVGRVGFSRTSVSRITEGAGVSLGTLYSYFESHQLLLGQLLSVEGARLFQALGEHKPSSEGFFAEERRRFGLLLRFLQERPFVLRLLTESEVAAPEGFFQYMHRIGQRYAAVFKRAQGAGEVRPATARENHMLAETLASCRAHIAFRVLSRMETAPAAAADYQRHAIDSYVKFLQQGIGADTVPMHTPKRRPPGLSATPSAPGAVPDMRTQLFEAAVPEVAAMGFTNTQVKSIAARAGISVGSFYSHFAGRDEFLTAFLHYARRQVTRYITQASAGSRTFAEFEVRSFRALFELIEQKPWLPRLFAEAAILQPLEYRHHLLVVSRDYRRRLRAAKARGELAHYRNDEIEALSVILTGGRRFLGSRFIGRTTNELPNWVAKSYVQLVCNGLAAPKKQRERQHRKQPRRVPSRPVRTYQRG